MIEHIVKYNEKIDDIINMYHISLEELIEYNSHITDFKNLISGSKLLIPLINKEVEQILEKTECFVMEYYPKISEDIIPSMEEKIIEKKEEKVVINKENNEVRENINKRAYPGIIPPKNPYKGR